MMQQSLERCPCCGLNIFTQPERGDCPRCGYPLAPEKEERFLLLTLRNLQRAVQYGREDLSVAALIDQYQTRLHALQQASKLAASAPRPQPRTAAPRPSYAPFQQRIPAPPTGSVEAHVPKSNADSATHTPKSVAASAIAAPKSAAAPVARGQVFSLRAFLADQTINIVASLGAFLLLAGSLSFVVTTTNLLLSFLITCITHIAFGAGGTLLRRFRNFRTVSTIYIIIFALLLPLVGFSAYRLVLQRLVEISPTVLVALAAVYAAIIYGILAVYQQFRLFGYLSAMALVVADLALAQALHISFWWWPSMLMVLTVPTLVSLSRTTRHGWPFSGRWVLLQEPARLLMFLCVGVCSFAICSALYTSLVLRTSVFSADDVHFALLSMLLLLFCWLTLFAWRTESVTLMQPVPYLFLACALAFAYALNFGMAGYVLTLTGVALLYHGLDLLAGRMLQRLGQLRLHMEGLALLLVGLVPLLVLSITPLIIFTQGLFGRLPTPSFSATTETVIELAAMVAGLLLTVSVVLKYSGLKRTSSTASGEWNWLLLLSGFILIWAYSLILLLFNAVFVWGFLGLALVLIAATIVLRRYTSAVWANPLDTIALGTVGLTLLLSMTQSTDTIVFLLILFAVLSYGMMLFQGRSNGLFLPIVFALIAILMPGNPFWVLACVAPGIALAAFVASRLAGKIWALPLYIIALSIAIMMGIAAYNQDKLLSATWMLFLFALVIYLIGVAENELALLWAAPCFAIWSTYYCGQLGDLYRVPLVALLCASIGVGIGCIRLRRPTLRDRLLRYALPFYATGAAAAVLTGVYGTLVDVNRPFYAATCIILLIYALVAYGILRFERRAEWQWIVAGFALWAIVLLPKTPACSLLFFALCSPHMQATSWSFIVVAVATGTLGLLAGRIGKRVEVAAGQSALLAKFQWSWVWYGSALAAIVVGAAWSYQVGELLPKDVELLMLGVFIALSFTIMLVERVPYMLPVPAILAAWTIAQVQASLWQQLIAYSVLCVVLFALRFAWFDMPATARTQLHEALGLGGQALVVVTSIAQGGLSAVSGILAFVGAGSLLVFALLFCWYGWLQAQKTTRHFYYYSTGLLLSLCVSWLLAALHVTYADWLALAPAIYLIVIASLVVRDDSIVSRHDIGQICAVLGAVFFFLPEFWISYQDNALLLLFLLAGKAIALLLFGIVMRSQLHQLLGLGGLALVVATSIARGGLSADSGALDFVGAGSLLVFALLLCLYGWLQAQKTIRRICYYSAGLLLSLCVSWVLVALSVTYADWLALAPAIYLIVIAPWMIRDNSIAGQNDIGQICAVLGAALLFLPELWVSHQDNTLLPLFLLAGKAVALLLFGIATRMQLHQILGLGGLALVVATSIARGGLSTDAGMLAFIGVGSLLVFALLLGWYGWLQAQKTIRQFCYYSAGLLLSLCVSWLLEALQMTHLDWLSLAPATYLIVIAPLLMREEQVEHHTDIGQLCALLGAALLLLPELWISFQDATLFPTLFLASEAIVLMLLGVATRMRVFALSGSALIVVSAMHALFLPSLSLSPSLALTILGGTLLVIATSLSLARHRLQVAWSQWE